MSPMTSTRLFAAAAQGDRGRGPAGVGSGAGDLRGLVTGVMLARCVAAYGLDPDGLRAATTRPSSPR
ncbi:MAG: hypothetical protein IPH03_18315 [Tetrasphaera sp.]|nr:hypothetical protein [Tetrasphaera sp.]